MISDKLIWNGVTHVWNWQWRDTLTESENLQLLDLQNLLT
ncbi:hypothetical protein A2U01_0114884, partial [Trifolium medium]|nr:hypothetical protein [Trifolium medium]